MKKVCIVGLGYIGLPTAAVLANRGFKIHGVDVNRQAISQINQGRPHIYEPDLAEALKRAVFSRQLSADTRPDEADVFILSVPTPFKDHHKPDLAYVKQAAQSIIPYLRPGNLVVLESTSPVGTTEKIAEWILAGRPELTIGKPGANRVFVAHCPERVLPGKILKEIISNDRIVGGIDPESTKLAASFYSTFVEGNILQTNARTAEMSKLTENAFRDVNIAFANELSGLCDRLDINVWELIELANHHPRVNILKPGPGVGGHCIAVDPWFIVDAAPDEAVLIHTARIVNDNKPDKVIEKIKQAAQHFKNPTIACLGLSFKANIDDLRESPSVEIVKRLADQKIGRIYAAEPHIHQLPSALEKAGVAFADAEEAVNKADIVVILVDHDVFKRLRSKLAGRCVIDTRGFLHRAPDARQEKPVLFADRIANV